MPFIRMPGVDGKVYVPDPATAREKKHPCKDCHSCQMCGDTRCRVCRGEDVPGRAIDLPARVK